MINFQVRLKTEDYGNLEQIAKRNGVSMADIIRKALKILNRIDQCEKNGGKVILEYNGESQEIWIV